MPANGAHTKIKEITAELGRQRTLGLDMSMSQMLKQKYSGGGSEVTIKDIYQELGIDINLTTLQQLWDTDYDARYLFPEIIREAILIGSISRSWYASVIASSETIAQKRMSMPWIEFDNAIPAESGEAQTIKKGGFKYSTKYVDMKKVAIGLEYTYEALQDSTINMVSMMFEEIGRKLGLLKNYKLIQVLINGEQADGSESAGVLGVIDTDKKLQYRDETRVAINGQLIARNYGIIITNQFQGEHLTNLDEHKIPYSGTPIQSLQIQSPIPRAADVIIDASVPANQYIFVDRSTAALEIIDKPLLLETDKIISKQVMETYASEYSAFAIIFRNGRVVVDESKVYETTNTHAYFPFLAPIIATPQE